MPELRLVSLINVNLEVQLFMYMSMSRHNKNLREISNGIGDDDMKLIREMTHYVADVLIAEVAITDATKAQRHKDYVIRLCNYISKASLANMNSTHTHTHTQSTTIKKNPLTL